MRPQTSYIWNLEISLDQVDDEKHFFNGLQISFNRKSVADWSNHFYT